MIEKKNKFKPFTSPQLLNSKEKIEIPVRISSNKDKKIAYKNKEMIPAKYYEKVLKESGKNDQKKNNHYSQTSTSSMTNSHTSSITYNSNGRISITNKSEELYDEEEKGNISMSGINKDENKKSTLSISDLKYYKGYSIFGNLSHAIDSDGEENRDEEEKDYYRHSNSSSYQNPRNSSSNENNSNNYYSSNSSRSSYRFSDISEVSSSKIIITEIGKANEKTMTRKSQYFDTVEEKPIVNRNSKHQRSKSESNNKLNKSHSIKEKENSIEDIFNETKVVMDNYKKLLSTKSSINSMRSNESEDDLKGDKLIAYQKLLSSHQSKSLNGSESDDENALNNEDLTTTTITYRTANIKQNRTPSLSSSLNNTVTLENKDQYKDLKKSNSENEEKMSDNLKKIKDSIEEKNLHPSEDETLEDENEVEKKAKKTNYSKDSIISKSFASFIEALDYNINKSDVPSTSSYISDSESYSSTSTLSSLSSLSSVSFNTDDINTTSFLS